MLAKERWRCREWTYATETGGFALASETAMNLPQPTFEIAPCAQTTSLNSIKTIVRRFLVLSITKDNPDKNDSHNIFKNLSHFKFLKISEKNAF